MVDLLGVIREKLEDILNIGKLGKIIGAREHLTKCELDHEGKTESPEDGRSDPTKVDSRFYTHLLRMAKAFPALQPPCFSWTAGAFLLPSVVFLFSLSFTIIL